MDASLIKAQITATWYELNQLGIEGMLKGDTVYIRELDHHHNNDFGQCALAENMDQQKQWVIPVIYLELL